MMIMMTLMIAMMMMTMMMASMEGEGDVAMRVHVESLFTFGLENNQYFGGDEEKDDEIFDILIQSIFW